MRTVAYIYSALNQLPNTAKDLQHTPEQAGFLT